jgi:hypothetical protein
MPKNKIYFLIFFDNVKKNNDIWHSLIEYPVGSRLPQTGRNPATKEKISLTM